MKKSPCLEMLGETPATPGEATLECVATHDRLPPAFAPANPRASRVRAQIFKGDQASENFTLQIFCADRHWNHRRRSAMIRCAIDLIRTRSPRPAYKRWQAIRGLIPISFQNACSLRLCCASRANLWSLPQQGSTHLSSGFLPRPDALPKAADANRTWAASPQGSTPHFRHGSCRISFR